MRSKHRMCRSTNVPMYVCISHPRLNRDERCATSSTRNVPKFSNSSSPSKSSTGAPLIFTERQLFLLRLQQHGEGCCNNKKVALLTQPAAVETADPRIYVIQCADVSLKNLLTNLTRVSTRTYVGGCVECWKKWGEMVPS